MEEQTTPKNTSKKQRIVGIVISALTAAVIIGLVVFRLFGSSGCPGGT